MQRINYFLLLSLGVFIFQLKADNYWLAEHDLDASEKEIIAGASEAHPADPQGGFLLAGFYLNDHIPFLIRINKFGSVIWKKRPSDFANYHEAFKCAHFTPDQNFLVGGNTGLMKINSATGAEMWNEPAVGLPGDDMVHYIEAYDTDKYIMLDYDFKVCYTYNAATKQVIDVKEFLSGWKNFCIKVTNDNKFIMSGEYNEQLTLCRMDFNLNIDPAFG